MADYGELFDSTWALILVILFFGGSIFVHELGHFLAARLCGLKILRFSIGFGPRIVSWTGKDGCKYMISLLPLGGYVALPQLADMGSLEGGSEDGENEEALKKLPPASCGAKIAVSAAGALFNLILAALLACVVWLVGIPENASYKTNIVGYVPEKISNIYGTEIESPAFAAGLRPGDKILEIDSAPVSDFPEIVERIAIGSGRDDDGNPMADLKIERGGKFIQIKIRPALVRTNLSTDDAIRMIGITPALAMRVGSIMENSPAQACGLKPGDLVRKIDGHTLYSNLQLSNYLENLPDNKEVVLSVERGGKVLSIPIKPAKVAITKPVCEISFGSSSLKLVCMPPNGADSFDKDDIGAIKVFSVPEIPAFADINPGDTLYEADGREIKTLTQINTLVNAKSDKSRLRLSFMDRDFKIKSALLPIGSSSKIVPSQTRSMLGYMLENATIISHPNIFEQFSDSISRTYNALSSLINPKSDIGIGSLAGPVDIGRVIYQLSLAHLCLVISFAVLLNVNLAILNMLPIPVLDGGHILMAILEKLRGKPLPPKFFAGVQGVFSILFISLMAYVVWCGFMRWNGDSKLEKMDEAREYAYIKNIKF